MNPSIFAICFSILPAGCIVRKFSISGGLSTCGTTIFGFWSLSAAEDLGKAGSVKIAIVRAISAVFKMTPWFYNIRFSDFEFWYLKCGRQP